MSEVYRAKLNYEGRIVIPAACRKKLGMVPGQDVLLQINDGGLFVYTQELCLSRLREWVVDRVAPGVSLADELLSERRAEAAKEANE
jgi:AbrB family looped-hinge helix DNA binding protein